MSNATQAPTTVSNLGVVMFTVAWSVGELAGYLTGPGDSLLKVR